MKVRKLAGLVCAGGANRSFLARMPALLGHIGPVAGTSLRVSRRIANSLKAGTGVSSFEPLASCPWIWLAVPEASLEELSAQLAAAIRLEGKTIVLCDAMRDSLLPGPLRTSGARVATLNLIPETNERLFVAEGHAGTLLELRKLLALEHRKLIELRPATKPLYLCGLHLAADLLLPVIAGSVESLRAAGFSREEAIRAVEAIGSRTLRSYGKAGLKAWKGLRRASASRPGGRNGRAPHDRSAPGIFMHRGLRLSHKLFRRRVRRTQASAQPARDEQRALDPRLAYFSISRCISFTRYPALARRLRISCAISTLR